MDIDYFYATAKQKLEHTAKSDGTCWNICNNLIVMNSIQHGWPDHISSLLYSMQPKLVQYSKKAETLVGRIKEI